MKIMICRKRSWMYNCPTRWYTVVDEMSVDEMSVDEMSVDEVSVDEMSVDELSWNRPILLSVSLRSSQAYNVITVIYIFSVEIFVIVISPRRIRFTRSCFAYLPPPPPNRL